LLLDVVDEFFLFAESELKHADTSGRFTIVYNYMG
jgi:hypothetical protein